MGVELVTTASSESVPRKSAVCAHAQIVEEAHDYLIHDRDCFVIDVSDLD